MPEVRCDADPVKSVVKQKTLSVLLSFDAGSLPDKVKLGCGCSESKREGEETIFGRCS
jgi:hypothetical protein